jgi:hypothetical protein
MDSNELCGILLEKHRLTVTPADILDQYVAKGLVPAPDPEEGFRPLSAGMVIASRFCMEEKQWSAERVAHAVSLVGYNVLQGESLAFLLGTTAGNLKGREEMPANRRQYWARRLHDAFQWGLSAVKAHMGLPLGDPVTLIECPEAAGDPGHPEFWVEYAIEPPEFDGEKHVNTIRYPRRYELREGGVWLNL